MSSRYGSNLIVHSLASSLSARGRAIKTSSISPPVAGERTGVGLFDPVTIQIQNDKRVIMWPEYAAEAKVLPMPKWEERGKK